MVILEHHFALIVISKTNKYWLLALLHVMVVQLRKVQNQNLIILDVSVPTLGTGFWSLDMHGTHGGLVWRSFEFPMVRCGGRMVVSARMLAILVTTTTSSSTFATNMQSRLGTLDVLEIGNKHEQTKCVENRGKCYEWLPNSPNMQVSCLFWSVLKLACDFHPPRIPGACLNKWFVDPCLSCFAFVNSLKTNTYNYYSVLERGKKSTAFLWNICFGMPCQGSKWNQASTARG